MGIKKVVGDIAGQVGQGAQNLVGMAVNTAGQMVNDAFIEYFRCLNMDGIICKPGELVQRDNGKKKANTNGTENLISNGSYFDVAINQCAILIENGKVHDCVVCLDNEMAGKYQYLTDVEPSFLCPSPSNDPDTTGVPSLKDTIGKTLKQYATRLAAGGQSVNTMNLLYINLAPITGIPVGGSANIYDDNICQSVHVGINGRISLEIANPIQFYEKYIRDPRKTVTVDEAKGILGEIRQYVGRNLKSAIQKLTKAVPDWHNIENYEEDLNILIHEVMGENLEKLYGIKMSQLPPNLTVELDAADRAKLNEYGAMQRLGRDSDAMRGNMAAAQVEMMKAQAQAQVKLAENSGKGGGGSTAMDMMAMTMMQNMNQQNMMNGMNQMGGYVNQAQQAALTAPQPAPAPVTQAPTQTPPASVSTPEDTWTCSCGTVNSNSKFCKDCGSPKPAPKPVTPPEDTWTCSCGAVNAGAKFCKDCGSPKPTPKPVTPPEDTWTCSCGAVNDGSKFCKDCGSPKPTPKPVNDNTWTCSCGAVNTTKFCKDCGSPKPTEPVVPDSNEWECPECHTMNTTKFCGGCGCKKPEPVKVKIYKCSKCGFNPPDPTKPPKFCPDCGDIFDDNDLI